MNTYTDENGTSYRAVGQCPRSELTPGTRYALPGDPQVYVWTREKRPDAGDAIANRLLLALHHGTNVTLLEPVE